ncbi:hypothetical protein L249_5613, partial [Ophiocordyceps polyrhachis-furcata BCC 54312]
IEEELKAGEVIVGKPPSFIDKFLNNKDFNVMDQPDDLTLVRPSRSGAMTAISTARRSLTARRSMYSAPIAVTIAVTSRFGRYDRYSPTVTQGVVAGLRPNWYNLFQGPNEIICGAKGKEEGGEKKVEMDEELTNREGDHVIEKKKRNHVIKVRKADADNSSKYFSRYFKVPTCSTLTYLYKIGDLEEDLYVPYPAVICGSGNDNE